MGADASSLRQLVAPNPGPFTFDGTRTWIVGRRHVLVIDPGPAIDEHLESIVEACADAQQVTLTVTHQHADHAAGLQRLAMLLRALAAGPSVHAHAPERSELVTGGPTPILPVREGYRLSTDAGLVEVVATPGHSRDHVAYWWRSRGALFCGDLVLGHGDTTWVGEYEGCVADYFASLGRLRSLGASVLHPGHGPDLPDPADALARFEAHRRQRVSQVRAVRDRYPDEWRAVLYHEVYRGRVPVGLERAARSSLHALADYVDTHG